MNSTAINGPWSDTRGGSAGDTVSEPKNSPHGLDYELAKPPHMEFVVNAVRRVGRCAVGCLLLALLTGCGGVTRRQVDAGAPSAVRRYKTRSGRQVSVTVGSVSSKAKLEKEAKDAVSRYLKDQATVALAGHDLFRVVDKRDKAADLLGQFMETDAGKTKELAVDAVLDVRVLEIREKLGATVKVGFASKQKKYAKATLELTLRLRNGRRTYRARNTGTASKGAWGVVAMVDRKQMRKGRGIWDLDGSMAGQACVHALQACVTQIAEQMAREMRRMRPDAADRFLRTKTAPHPVSSAPAFRRVK